MRSGLAATERRRNRTFQPVGCTGLPVLKCAALSVFELRVAQTRSGQLAKRTSELRSSGQTSDKLCSRIPQDDGPWPDTPTTPNFARRTSTTKAGTAAHGYRRSARQKPSAGADSRHRPRCARSNRRGRHGDLSPRGAMALRLRVATGSADPGDGLWHPRAPRGTCRRSRRGTTHETAPRRTASPRRMLTRRDELTGRPANGNSRAQPHRAEARSARSPPPTECWRGPDMRHRCLD